MLRLWLSVLLSGAGTSGADVSGALGKSVAFKVKTSPPYETISWNKTEQGGHYSFCIAEVNFTEPCRFQFTHPSLKNRLKLSNNCRELHLDRLEKGDAGRYTAEIVLSSGAKSESFNLRIFRRWLDSDLKVTCTPDGAGSGAWHLNCSVGTWEDGLKLSWAPAVRSTGPTPESSVLKLASQGRDLQVTCTAKNRDNNVSRTVSLKHICGHNMSMKILDCPDQRLSRLPLWALLCLSKMGALILLGCLGLILRTKFRKVDGKGRRLAQFPPASQRSPPSSPTARAHRCPSPTSDSADGSLPPATPSPDNQRLPQRLLRRVFGGRALPWATQ